MSSSAVSFGGPCAALYSIAAIGHDMFDSLQQDSCQSACNRHDPYSVEEADFLRALLENQEDAARSVDLFTDEGADTSGMQAAMSDVSTTFGDWDTDEAVPSITGATSQVSQLQSPVNPTSLMLQLDYSDVISTWEEMAADQKHPISRTSSQQFRPDQFTCLQSPNLYTIPQAPHAIMDAHLNLNLDFSSASMPSFDAPSRGPARACPVRHVTCVDPVSKPALPLHHTAIAPRTAAEKTASLERYREKKATRQSGTGKIRYQIRKTNADNRPRFKGCFVKPSKLAELQMDAVLNGDSYLPSSPMISGGSSDSTFV